MASADRAFRGDRYEVAKAEAEADRPAMEAAGWTFDSERVEKESTHGANRLVYHYTAPDAPAPETAPAPATAAPTTSGGSKAVKGWPGNASPAQAVGTQPPATIVRTYRGSEQDAARQFQRDAAELAKSGYRPTGQTWAPGSYGCGCFLVAALLLLFVVGILILLYLIMVKPAGTLTVTYTLADAPQPVVVSPPAGFADQLEQLTKARDTGLITPAEYDAKRAELLQRL